MAVIVAASLVAPPKAKAHPHSCAERATAMQRLHCYAHRRCSNARPRWCLANARVHYHLRRWERRWLWGRSWCESRHNPLEVASRPVGNERALGELQFLPSTWATTPYGGLSIWKARWQFLAGAWMLRAGRGGEWAC